MHAFEILADPVRRRIVELLGPGERAAGEVGALIQSEFGISQPAVSQHLRVLREAGFATVRVAGARRLYAVDPAPLQEVDRWIQPYRRFWNQRLDALDVEIARGRRARRASSNPDPRGEHTMTSAPTTYNEPDPELRHRTIAAGPARVAVFTRVYDTTIEDLWAACTDPERLRRWYVPVSGDFRVGGQFQQVNMGSGTILECDAPRFLKLSLGGGADEIELRLSPGPRAESATLHLEHATTLDAHEIGGQMYDAIFCMGGGYYPRLQALDQHLRGILPDDYDAAAFHLNPDTRPAIERGSAAMAAVLEADKDQ